MELFSFREKRAAMHRTTVSKLLKKRRRDSSWFHVVISGGETEKLLGIAACYFEVCMRGMIRTSFDSCRLEVRLHDLAAV
jgi:hypothetical protein